MGRQLLRWLPTIVVAATFAYTVSVYSSLPARMPTHWGINGQPNGWSSRELGAWLLPAMMVFLYFLFLAADNYQKIGVAYDVLGTAILSFQAVIQYAMLSVAQGHPVDINKIVFVAVGALFVVIGLSHKPGGFLMVMSGVLTIVAALTAPPPTALVVLLATSIVATAGSALLSYLHWRQR